MKTLFYFMSLTFSVKYFMIDWIDILAIHFISTRWNGTCLSCYLDGWMRTTLIYFFENALVQRSETLPISLSEAYLRSHMWCKIFNNFRFIPLVIFILRILKNRLQKNMPFPTKGFWIHAKLASLIFCAIMYLSFLWQKRQLLNYGW